MSVPAVVHFVEGYRNGAQCVNADVTVLISYTTSFGDPDQGAQMAQAMIGHRADAIFAAGGDGDPVRRMGHRRRRGPVNDSLNERHRGRLRQSAQQRNEACGQRRLFHHLRHRPQRLNLGNGQI
ncbi:MAG: BMP family ABC transporter substrate-binding protein [Ardenticatenia bacterium]|nr:BMP family ABC transporter substrate-binding protein [Ardenticatenia bacterium]